MDAWPKSAGEAIHTGTFFGHPFSCEVGRRTLEIMRREGLIERSREFGKKALAHLRELLPISSGVTDIRGEGLMLGIKCRVPNTEIAAAARAEGLLLVPAGENVVRLLPPLIVGPAEIDEAVRRLEAALETLGRQAAAE